MTKQETQDSIRVLSREKECVQQAVETCVNGGGYASPDGMIRADDYVNACSIAIAALSEKMKEYLIMDMYDYV